MDTLTESELRWRIEGPGLDTGTDFDRSDGSQGFGRGVARRSIWYAANIRFRSTVRTTRPGDYSFQLLDLGEAEQLSPEQTETASLVTGGNPHLCV